MMTKTMANAAIDAAALSRVAARTPIRRLKLEVLDELKLFSK